MKLVRITTVYQAYIDRFFAKNLNLIGMNYQEQKSKLDYDGFGWADFWKNALEPLGYTVIDIYSNIAPLQQAWAKEHSCKYRSNQWVLDITESQIICEKPDVLFVDDYSTFSYGWLTQLKEKCSSIKLVLGWCGAPFYDPSVFKAYDMVLSNVPELVEQFKQMGHNSFHLNHAFDPRILERINLENNFFYDFSFVGQIVRRNEFHMERERILESLISQVNIKIFSPSAKLSIKTEADTLLRKGLYCAAKVMKKTGIPQSVLSTLPFIKIAGKWNSCPISPVNKKLSPYMRPGVFGLEMFQTLRNSKATFNNHIGISVHSASNMRLFEATGVGTCLVTDWKENIHDLFEPNSEVVTYKTPEECVEKVIWLMEKPAEREAIARAGQNRTLKYHTFAQRAIRLDEIIRKGLAKKS